jgi:thioredoxin reductase
LPDDSQYVNVYLNYKRTKLRSGIPVSAALYEMGIYGLYRSLRYGKLRGVRTLDWWGSERILTDNFEINPGVVNVREGMHIYYENSPAPLSSLLWVFRKRFNVGFYHGFVFRNKIGWGLFTKILDRMLPYHVPPDKNSIGHPPKPIKIDTDVLIVGGGVSGLSASVALAKSGLKTVVVDANSSIGGYLRPYTNMYLGELGYSSELLDNLIKDAIKSGVKIVKNVVFQGILEDASLGYNIVSKETILFNYRVLLIATGKRDNYPVYENNDLPKSMFLSTAISLLNNYDILPGSRGLIIGVTPYSVASIKYFMEKGIDLIIIDRRPQRMLERYVDIHTSSLPKVETYFDISSIVAFGKNRVEGVKIQLKDGSEKYIDVDFIAYSPSLLPDNEVTGQFNIPFSFDIRLGGFVPHHSLVGETPLENIFITGSAGGVIPVEVEFYLSRAIGYYIANRFSGKVVSSDYDNNFNISIDILKKKYYPLYLALEQLSDSLDSGKTYSYSPWDEVPSIFNGDYSKMFVCPDMDVTVYDLKYLVNKLGFWRMEYIKRLSGLGTGRCQGRDCIFNAALLLSKWTGMAPNKIGRFRTRYPTIPHNLYSLSGVVL